MDQHLWRKKKQQIEAMGIGMLHDMLDRHFEKYLENGKGLVDASASKHLLIADYCAFCIRKKDPDETYVEDFY